MSEKLIIVTGGAGFIGSAIVWKLNEMGYENIIIVDHLGESDKWKNLRSLKFMDYVEKDKFIDTIHNNENPYSADCIFHMGACSATTQSDASYLIQNNFEYTRDLAICAMKKNIRFIYASSAATYGDGSSGYLDNESDMDQLRPLNMYGYSKQLFDQWARHHKVLNKIVGLKFFNVFGPNEWHKGDMRSMVVKAYEQIKDKGEIALFKSYKTEYNDGEQVRDFIYIKDAVQMAIHFYENRDGIYSGIFNVGTSQTRSWNDLAKAVFKAMNLDPKINYIDMPPALTDRYQYHTQANIDKLRDTGYKKELWTLEAAIGDYVNSYLIPHDHLGDN